MSGVELSFTRDYKACSLKQMEGNVRCIHKDINYMKQDLNQSTFTQWCKKVAKYNEYK